MIELDDNEAPILREKGLGTCRACGKRTLGKSNDLCSSCGGTSVNTMLGLPEGGDVFLQRQPGWEKARLGYPVPRFIVNPHCPKCQKELFVIGAQSCGKCGRFESKV